ncbi:telomere repeats-binding bouquet formation protein 2 isoform X2 [Tachysurus fulvidraco]|uniref:telomere repeats-binding bouquet formation protein 2 isoform X2 n=1 Tax=Tachysurus fulvidraco TaxID=1234273 RepID=UPI000F50910F|nr:telomere repeats-binding bouquet formation protein 2 isoform X2 [Tachysurus fulvidraco]
MFKNKTAWFSDSVKTDIRRIWASQGGVITDWKSADYLFSEDASCPDTNRIHMSVEYVTDRATVFHSAYLSTCQMRQSTKSVPLGHYLLPPVPVQREVKAQIGRFIWEQDEMLGANAQHADRRSEQITYIQTDSKGSQTEKGKKRQENCTNTSPSRHKSVCCKAQLYPVNNMLSGFTGRPQGYVHIDQLKKFSGELHDFLPSHSGYSVSRPHSRRVPYRYKEGH